MAQARQLLIYSISMFLQLTLAARDNERKEEVNQNKNALL